MKEFSGPPPCGASRSPTGRMSRCRHRLVLKSAAFSSFYVGTLEWLRWNVCMCGIEGKLRWNPVQSPRHGILSAFSSFRNKRVFFVEVCNRALYCHRSSTLYGDPMGAEMRWTVICLRQRLLSRCTLDSMARNQIGIRRQRSLVCKTTEGVNRRKGLMTLGSEREYGSLLVDGASSCTKLLISGLQSRWALLSSVFFWMGPVPKDG